MSHSPMSPTQSHDEVGGESQVPHTLVTKRSAYVAKARRRYPGAEWIMGNGPYASVAHCGVISGVITIQLYATQAEAEIAKRVIDDTACGHRCHRHHEIVNL